MSKPIRVFVRLYKANDDTPNVAMLQQPLSWNAVVTEMLRAAKKDHVGTMYNYETIQKCRVFLLPTGINGVGAEINERALRFGIRETDEFMVCAEGEAYNKTQAKQTLRPMQNPVPNQSNQQSKKKRYRSISGRMAVMKILGDQGIISQADKGLLKDLLVQGDHAQLEQALDKFAHTGEAAEIRGLLDGNLQRKKGVTSFTWDEQTFLQEMALEPLPIEHTEIPQPPATHPRQPIQQTQHQSQKHQHGQHQQQHQQHHQQHSQQQNGHHPILQRAQTSFEINDRLSNGSGYQSRGPSFNRQYSESMMSRQQQQQQQQHAQMNPQSMYSSAPMGHSTLSMMQQMGMMNSRAVVDHAIPQQENYGMAPQQYLGSSSMGYQYGLPYQTSSWHNKLPSMSYPPAVSKEEKKKKIEKWLQKRARRNWSSKPSYPVRHKIAQARKRGQDGRFITKAKLKEMAEAEAAAAAAAGGNPVSTPAEPSIMPVATIAPPSSAAVTVA